MGINYSLLAIDAPRRDIAFKTRFKRFKFAGLTANGARVNNRQIILFNPRLCYRPACLFYRHINLTRSHFQTT